MNERVLRALERRELQILQAAGEAEIRAAVVARLAAEAASLPALDADRLIGDGNALARAGRDDVDEMAITWLSRGPPEEGRVVATLFFLQGFWGAGSLEAPIPGKRIRELLRALDRVRGRSEEVEYTQVLALSSALVAGVRGFRDEVASRLRTLASREWSPPLVAPVRVSVARALDAEEAAP